MACASNSISAGTPLTIRNNIIWTQNGFDLNVDPSANTSLASDYNDLYVTGQGKVGQWQSVPRPALIDWQNASSNDTNSISADPLFVNAAGGDFHEKSQFGSYHGGSLAPSYRFGNGFACRGCDTIANERCGHVAGGRSRQPRRFVQQRARAQRLGD